MSMPGRVIAPWHLDVVACVYACRYTMVCDDYVFMNHVIWIPVKHTLIWTWPHAKHKHGFCNHDMMQFLGRSLVTASVFDGAPPGGASHLVSLLTYFWAWGHMSPQTLQQICAAVEKDLGYVVGALWGNRCSMHATVPCDVCCSGEYWCNRDHM